MTSSAVSAESILRAKRAHPAGRALAHPTTGRAPRAVSRTATNRIEP